MIVRKQNDGSLILVNQNDHAKLSGQFAAHWGNALFAQPRPQESMIRAAMYHDFGWNRYESSPSYDPIKKAAPTFFEVPNSDAQLTEFANAIRWLTNIDEYAGLLINRHRTGLWRQRYGTVNQPPPMNKSLAETTVQRFIEEHEAMQETLIAKYDRSEVNINYRLLQFLDLFSLAFCTKEFSGAVFDPVPTSYDENAKGVEVRMSLREDGKVEVDPYPFDTHELTLSYVYRHLSTSDFPDEASFRHAYFAAPLRMKVMTFVPSAK